ncbi:acyl-CoA N-acyltransferase [Nemania serpens]|nr:acyl-CoA N-acyltransferase [Nemania serpens]
MGFLYPKIAFRPPPGYRVRDAKLTDADDLTNIWYGSFNASHKLFEYATPDDAPTRKWFNELWTMGIEAGPGVIKTFVVEDLSKESKLVGFARFHVPQVDGNQDVPKPEVPDHWDPEVTDAIWGQIARSRERVMGQKTHWMAEFIGVDQGYQDKHLGHMFMDWGLRQADATGLQIYGDSTIRGLPIWKKYGFKEVGALHVPERPGLFEAYTIVPILWTPGTKETRDIMAKL